MLQRKSELLVLIAVIFDNEQNYIIMGNVQTLVSKCLFQRNIKPPIEDSKQANMVPTKEIQGQNCNKIYWSQLALGNITKKNQKGTRLAKPGT